MTRLSDFRELLAAYERKLADPAYPEALARAGIARTKAAIRRLERMTDLAPA